MVRYIQLSTLGHLEAIVSVRSKAVASLLIEYLFVDVLHLFLFLLCDYVCSF